MDNHFTNGSAHRRWDFPCAAATSSASHAKSRRRRAAEKNSSGRCRLASRSCLNGHSVKVKTCPNCKSTIEEESCCDHMACRNCTHELCWMCMKLWKTYPQEFYHCNAYKPKDDPFLKKPDKISQNLISSQGAVSRQEFSESVRK
jgi:hypothetical protein